MPDNSSLEEILKLIESHEWYKREAHSMENRSKSLDETHTYSYCSESDSDKSSLGAASSVCNLGFNLDSDDFGQQLMVLDSKLERMKSQYQENQRNLNAHSASFKWCSETAPDWPKDSSMNCGKSGHTLNELRMCPARNKQCDGCGKLVTGKSVAMHQSRIISLDQVGSHGHFNEQSVLSLSLPFGLIWQFLLLPAVPPVTWIPLIPQIPPVPAVLPVPSFPAVPLVPVIPAVLTVLTGFRFIYAIPVPMMVGSEMCQPETFFGELLNSFLEFWRTSTLDTSIFDNDFKDRMSP